MTSWGGERPVTQHAGVVPPLRASKIPPVAAVAASQPAAARAWDTEGSWLTEVPGR